MTTKERHELGLAIMREEEKGLTDKLRSLGKSVLDEVFRLEHAGEIEEAKDFEAFIPIDENYLGFLAPLVGEEELTNVLSEYRECKRKQRDEYLTKTATIHIGDFD